MTTLLVNGVVDVSKGHQDSHKSRSTDTGVKVDLVSSLKPVEKATCTITADCAVSFRVEIQFCYAPVMDFLKSAVASAIAKGPLAGYILADRVDLEESIWTLNNATKRVGMTSDTALAGTGTDHG